MRSWRRLIVTGLVLLSMLAPASIGGARNTQSCTWSIGIMGALHGDYARYGAPMGNAIRLAVEIANREDDLPCTLTVHAENSEGDPNQAPSKAQNLVEDPEVAACVCGFFSGETLATGGIFEEGGLAMLSTGSHRIIDQQGFETWFRMVAPDPAQGAAAAQYLVERMGAKTISVVYAHNEDYSQGLANDVARGVGDRLQEKYVINPEQTDYSAVVAQIAERDPDAIFYGGYWPQAGALLDQLRDEGVKAPLIVPEGSKDRLIGRALRVAGRARLKSICPCSDPEEIESAAAFVEEFRTTYAKRPRGYAADAFDAANLAIDALRQLKGSESTEQARASVVAYLDGAEDVPGTVKDYGWDERGELQADESHVFVWKWLDEPRRWEYVGRVSDLL